MNAARQDRTLTALTITNIVLGALILLLACGVAFALFYEPEVEAEDVQPYVREVRQRLDEHSSEIQDEAAELAAEIGPPMADAIYEQAQEDYGVYLRTLKSEGHEYLASVEQMIAAKVRAKYDDYLRTHRHVLAEEFPEHASKENVEQVLDEFEQTFGKIAERYYLDDFRREADRTVALWQQFEPVEPPGPNQPPFSEQLADYVADWTVLNVAPPIAETPGNGTKDEKVPPGPSSPGG